MISCKRTIQKLFPKTAVRASLFGVGLLAVVGICQGCRTVDNPQNTGNQEPTLPQASASEHSHLPEVECMAPETNSAEPTHLEASYTVLNEQGDAEYEVSGDNVFQPATLPIQAIDFDEPAMLNVLKGTRDYFVKHGCKDMKVLRNGLLGTQGVQHTHVLDTLDFMIDVLEEDMTAGVPARLKNADFINANFRVIRWRGFDPEYPAEDRLRITKYAVFTHPGSRQRTEFFNTPVYALKNEGEDQSFITQYTKQDVLGGVFETGGAEAGKVKTLAYMTRQGFEDALMQGTAFVDFGDGSATYFNVDKNNGIAFVAGVDPWQQQRYWYFKEVNKLNGYGYESAAKIPIEPGVTFAGDVMNIGLGKLVAIEAGDQTLKFGLIADTGGAFLPNLGQLDYFAGVFPTREAYQQSVSKMPGYAQAYLLIKK